MNVPSSKIFHILLYPAITILFFLLITPSFDAIAQDLCENPVEEVNGFVPPQEYSPFVSIRIDQLSKFPNRDSAAVLCVNINNPGYYRIKTLIEYSEGSEQNNESFFMHVTNSGTNKVIDPCNPNLGPHRVIVPDPTQTDTTIVERNAGVFWFTKGKNIISFVHYYRIHDRKPEYGKFVNGTFDTSKTESVHLLRLTLEPLPSCPTRVLNNYDIGLTKTVSPMTVSPGQKFNYSMEVTNFGPKRAFIVTLKDILPDSIFPRNFRVSPPIDSTARPLRWRFATLDSGEVKNIEFSAVFPESFVMNADSLQMLNRSFIEASFDNNAQNDTAVATITVIKQPPIFDLSLTKNVSPSTVLPGETFNYSLQIQNNGPDTANNIRLTDLLPDSIEAVNFITDVPIDPTSRVLEWDLATLDSGEVKNVEFSAIFRDSLSGTAREFLNIGFVATSFDTNTQNDTAIARVNVLPRPPNYDLMLAKSVSSDTVIQGQTFSYRLEITNNGPEAAPRFFIWDVFPDGVSLSDFNLQPINPLAADTLRWQIDQPLLAGETITITYTGLCRAVSNSTNSQIKINKATVDGENDSDPTNDSATASIVSLVLTNSCDRFVTLDRSLFEPENQTPLEIIVELNTFTDVSLDIFDITGHPIKRISTVNASVGANTFFWDGETNQGLKAGSGVYIIVVRDKASNGRRLECIQKVLLAR